jgi:adenine phosphoribosyltransferase
MRENTLVYYFRRIIMDLKAIIRDIPDFPKEGILFRDITPVLQNPEAFKYAIDVMAEKLKDTEFDVILGPESRGFIFGAPLAYALGKSFVLVRKKGKLPHETVRVEYDLEYGTDILEMHKDSVKPGQKVVIVDDLLATGGTSKAIVDMVENVGGKVAALVNLIELEGLNGREKLKEYEVKSIIKY